MRIKMGKALNRDRKSREDRLSRVLSRVSDYGLLTSYVTKIQDCRCWSVRARCFLTKKLLFGKKCTKVTTVRDTTLTLRVEKTFYFDPNQYLIWKLKR